MRCCANCFGDRDLAEIIAVRSAEKGVCSYCQSADVDLVEPKVLGDYFSLVIAIYEPDETGKLLVEWLKNDWTLFEDQRMNVAAAKSLLADILDDNEIVEQLFSPSRRFQSDALARWERLRDELMYRNRYFPDYQIGEERFKELLGHLRAYDLPTRWYRARIQTGDIMLTMGEMGAPSRRLASHGRANPSGIPYLYLSSSAITAISEIRPHTGELMCVATFSLSPDLNLVDLRNPRKVVSPFRLEDENKIGFMRVEIAFLDRLGEELTRPVLPQGAAIDYVPSQYLCEFIKKCGYDGVVYRSSVGDGINLALFDPGKATAEAVTQYRVTRVLVDIEKAQG